MRQRNRSSSFSYNNTKRQEAGAASSYSQTSTTGQLIDARACNSLLDLSLHARDTDGRTFLHRAVLAASSGCGEVSMDGLFLMNALVTRAKDMDRYSRDSIKGKGNNNKFPSPAGAPPAHHPKMMLAKDLESGYTALHDAILRRNLPSLLLLLKHACHTADEDAYGSAYAPPPIQHPLRLLEGNLREDELFGVMNDLAAALDNDKLTPLRLLSATSAGELKNCRETLQWKNLMKVWGDGSAPTQSNYGKEANDGALASSRRYRRRMISFGDEHDHVLFDDEPSDHFEGRHDGRLRSGSFNVDPLTHDDEDDDLIDVVQGGSDAVLAADVDFEALASDDGSNHEDDLSEEEQEEPTNSNPQLDHDNQHLSRAENKPHAWAVTQPCAADYGCEVLTFGKADNFALGVPQFSTAGRREKRCDNNLYGSTVGGGNGVVKSLPDALSSTCKPKRVEAFALGEMRRKWYNSTSDTASEVGAVDSPAVAIAAAAHHTLVATRGGRLFAFGLGKGGRLGTGDENHRPLPTRVMGPLTKRIVASIAAAENHSLCSTAEGDVYAWGSNGFGQLGMPSSQNQNGSRLSPRRVEDLRHSFVVAVAAGDRHSVALTRVGGVYTWGDNRSGQLGTMSLHSSDRDSASGPWCVNREATISTSPFGGKCCHHPQRVEGLWSAKPRRRAIAIAAAEFSTLVLTTPPSVASGESSFTSLPVNLVYEWGHGNHVPMRIIFPANNDTSIPESSDEQSYKSESHSGPTCINPTAIACAQYHNAAITADGRVYTWGLHSEPLGIEKRDKGKGTSDRMRLSKGKRSSQSSAIASPHLVVGLLPENGGGQAVAVSASESHTTVVTADGQLFTWGATYGNDVLGHKGVRWQPSPRRVKGFHRVVAVSSAKEHTALLVGTSFPSLPHSPRFLCDSPPTDARINSPHKCHDLLSLQDLAAAEIARNVDVFNVVPIAIAAHRVNCKPLIKFCDMFLHLNVDGVLSVGSKTDLETFLCDRTMFGATIERTDQCDQFFHPLLYHLANSRDWMDQSQKILKQYSLSSQPKIKKRQKKSLMMESIQKETEEEKAVMTPKKSKSSVVKMQELIPCDKNAQARLSDNCKSLQASQDRPQNTPHIETPKENHKILKTSTEKKKFHCRVCNVSCPDIDSYTLHINGRKHRNQLNHAKADEERRLSESMLAMKQIQLNSSNDRDIVTSNIPSTKAKTPCSPPILKTSNIDMKSTPKSIWATPQSEKSSVDSKPRSNSFLDILNEERHKASKMPGFQASPEKRHSRTQVQKKNSTLKQPNFKNAASPTIIAKNPPNFSLRKSPSELADKSPTTPRASVPLSLFMESDNKKKAAKKKGCEPSTPCWAGKPSKDSSTISQARSMAKSFSDIQKEEEAMREKEDQMCRIGGNKWYVQQRERAVSIGEIQEQEKKDTKWRLFIEEQKQIEEEIARENHERQKPKRKGKKKQRKKQESNRSGKASDKSSLNLSRKIAAASVESAR